MTRKKESAVSHFRPYTAPELIAALFPMAEGDVKAIHQAIEAVQSGMIATNGHVIQWYHTPENQPMTWVRPTQKSH